MTEPVGGAATRFVVVPQWQGSPSSRAMRLVTGAEAVLGDLPSRSTSLVEVPLGAGEDLGTGIRRYSSLLSTRERLSVALEGDAPAVVIGGDCSVAVPAVEHTARRAGGPVALIWLDAHADFHTPGSSPSGAFAGMALRTSVGGRADGLSSRPSVPGARTTLIGARSFDDAEPPLLEEEGVRLVDVTGMEDADGAAGIAVPDDVTGVHVHIDLDVLDPSAVSGTSSAEPFGPSLETVLALIGAVRARGPVLGASLAGFAPVDADAATADLPVILRMLGALTRRSS